MISMLVNRVGPFNDQQNRGLIDRYVDCMDGTSE
jgi:hypothetical protein